MEEFNEKKNESARQPSEAREKRDRLRERLTQTDYLEYAGEAFSGDTGEMVADFIMKFAGRLAGEGLGHYNVTHSGKNKFLDACVKTFTEGI